LNHASQFPVPPATRIASIGLIRLIDSDIDLDGFTDETLAEVQHMASRFTDDGAQVLVSIVAETDQQRVTGHAEVEMKWFENLVCVHTLLNTPVDLSAMRATSLGKSNLKSRKDVDATRLAQIGVDLGDSWLKTGRLRKTTRASTLAWMDLADPFLSESETRLTDVVRLYVATGKPTRAERRRIGNFCRTTSHSLLNKQGHPIEGVSD